MVENSKTNLFAKLFANSESRLDKFLVSSLPNISRSRIEKAIKNGKVTVNGKVVTKAGFKLKPNDEVCIQEPFDEPNSDKFKSDESEESLSFNNQPKILYEDERLIIINKPSGLPVHPGAGVRSYTVVDYLKNMIQEASFFDSTRAGIVHRLDKDTSGVLVCAKDSATQRVISKLFHDRLVEKRYLSLNYVGKNSKFLREGDSFIRCWIRRDSSDRRKFKCYDKPVSNSKESLTKFRLLFCKDGIALIEFMPITGRTHQLRALSAFMNSPIINDTLYGAGFTGNLPPMLQAQLKRVKRLMLHAYSIKFTNPFSGTQISVFAPVPQEFIDIAACLNCHQIFKPFLNNQGF